MALWLNLKINRDLVGRLEVVRVTNTEGTPGPDVVSNYKVVKDGKRIGEVCHRYGDGPWMLLALASGLAAEAP